MKPVTFLGSSQSDLRSFPAEVRYALGVEIMRVQHGAMPSDWKPFVTAGAGACEIRYRGTDGAWRVIYVAKRENAIYVLHAFKKTSQKTSPADIALARARYAMIGD